MVRTESLTANKIILEQLAKWGKLILNAPLNEYTSFKTGGPADVLVYPHNNKVLSEIIKLSKNEKIPLTIIGGGSNLLIGDKGIRGIVVRMGSDEIINGEIKIINENIIYADAIVSKQKFIDFSIDNHYMGIEFMVGISGNIGGGIVMNAGTFMGTFSDILCKVFYIDQNGIFKEKDIDKKMASYRNLKLNDAIIITGGNFKLPSCPDIKKLKGEIADINADRISKHPLEYPSAGSVFKNPDGCQAWKLVNDTGLKGKKIGAAMVSEKHTNFIINTGKATSSDIKNMIEYVQDQVLNKFGVKLYTEIRMIGEF